MNKDIRCEAITRAKKQCKLFVKPEYNYPKNLCMHHFSMWQDVKQGEIKNLRERIEVHQQELDLGKEVEYHRQEIETLENLITLKKKEGKIE